MLLLAQGPSRLPSLLFEAKLRYLTWVCVCVCAVSGVLISAGFLDVRQDIFFYHD